MPCKLSIDSASWDRANTQNDAVRAETLHAAPDAQYGMLSLQQAT